MKELDSRTRRVQQAILRAHELVPRKHQEDFAGAAYVIWQEWDAVLEERDRWAAKVVELERRLEVIRVASLGKNAPKPG